MSRRPAGLHSGGPATGRRLAATFAVALVLAVTVSAAACSSLRNGLGSPDGACYRALPAAKVAVHGRGQLIGEKLTTVPWIRANAPTLAAAAGAGPQSSTGSVCLFAFSGSYRHNQVERPLRRSSGKVAIAVVAFPSGVLRATALLRRVPVRFVHDLFRPASQ